MKATIDRLQNKLERLVSVHQEVKSSNLQLKEKLLSLQEHLEKEQKSVSELKDKNKILKLSYLCTEKSRIRKRQDNELTS